jgi:hypothetical protein
MTTKKQALIIALFVAVTALNLTGVALLVGMLMDSGGPGFGP